jgi:hypothetical protein
VRADEVTGLLDLLGGVAGPLTSIERRERWPSEVVVPLLTLGRDPRDRWPQPERRGIVANPRAAETPRLPTFFSNVERRWTVPC